MKSSLVTGVFSNIRKACTSGTWGAIHHLQQGTLRTRASVASMVSHEVFDPSPLWTVGCRVKRALTACPGRTRAAYVPSQQWMGALLSVSSHSAAGPPDTPRSEDALQAVSRMAGQ